VKSSVFTLALFLLLPLTACGSTKPGTTLPHNQWTWVSGTDSLNQPGVYGTQGVPGTANMPGARLYPSFWTDPHGHFWLFGGYGVDSTGASHQGDLNDLWEFTGGEWTWVDGADLADQPASYGTEGMPSPSNIPGPRYQATSWTDPAGNFWLFGGLGLDSQAVRGSLNDLWKYADGQWTWMGGSDRCCQPGIYGTRGKPGPSNAPGARVYASSWTDSSGNLWLFGGFGYDCNGNLGILNDLWKYSAGQWTWIDGARKINQFGVYGIEGTPSPNNTPGARSSAMTWIDSSGSLWLFGGQGNDSNGLLCQQNGGPCELNDLWRYSAGEWTWMGGSNVVQQPGTYGTKGKPAPGNFPGARESAVSWTAADGTFWLFGGFGFDSTQPPGPAFGDLNDLWKLSGGEWTWMGGSDHAGQTGSYGTKGTPDPSNIPGARDSAIGWIDPLGDLWLFGGSDLSTPGGGKFNDLWEYQP
jgi:hypothetical protein